MTTPHKATPEQWEHVEQRILAIDPGCSCLIELRDRITALEAAANSKPTPNPSQIRSSAPAGGLVDLLILTAGLSRDEASASILAVAEHIRQIGCLNSNAIAQWLEMELQSHG